MKAGFIKRALAYFLDMFVISLFFSIISFGFQSKTLDEYDEKSLELANNYAEGLVSEEEFLDEYYDLFYETQKVSVGLNGVYLGLLFVYFVVFQYLNHGQTIGKRLMKIRIESSSGSLGLGRLLVRNFIPNMIIVYLVLTVGVMIFDSKIFLSLYSMCSFGYYIFLVVSVFMILYGKSGKGIHDCIAGTLVVMEEDRNEL